MVDEGKREPFDLDALQINPLEEMFWDLVACCFKMPAEKMLQSADSIVSIQNLMQNWRNLIGGRTTKPHGTLLSDSVRAFPGLRDVWEGKEPVPLYPIKDKTILARVRGLGRTDFEELWVSDDATYLFRIWCIVLISGDQSFLSEIDPQNLTDTVVGPFRKSISLATERGNTCGLAQGYLEHILTINDVSWDELREEVMPLGKQKKESRNRNFRRLYRQFDLDKKWYVDAWRDLFRALVKLRVRKNQCMTEEGDDTIVHFAATMTITFVALRTTDLMMRRYWKDLAERRRAELLLSIYDESAAWLESRLNGSLAKN